MLHIKDNLFDKILQQRQPHVYENLGFHLLHQDRDNRARSRCSSYFFSLGAPTYSFTLLLNKAAIVLQCRSASLKVTAQISVLKSLLTQSSSLKSSLTQSYYQEATVRN